MPDNALDDFLICGGSAPLDERLAKQTSEIASLRQAIEQLSGRVESLLSRFEVEDARRQNAAIRQHKPVAAFKATTATNTTAASGGHSVFTFTPTWFGNGGGG